MTNFDKKKFQEVVLYVLGVTGGIDFYHVFKILYFAEMKHLATWGNGFIPDDFCALKYGPVPTILYDAVKNIGFSGVEFSKELSEVVILAGEDAPNVLLPKRMADTEYLSKSEIKALDDSIAENESLTFEQLKNKSHDTAWREAFKKVNGTNIISPLSMAKVIHADDAILEYLKEQMEIDSALQN